MATNLQNYRMAKRAEQSALMAGKNHIRKTAAELQAAQNARAQVRLEMSAHDDIFRIEPYRADYFFNQRTS